MERRDFLAAGSAGLFAAAIASERAEAEGNIAQAFGRSVAEFGVTPDTAEDQSKALQKALAEIAAANQPAFIPPGRYPVENVELPPALSLFGVPGASILMPKRNSPALVANSAKRLRLSGLAFDGGAEGLTRNASPACVYLSDSEVLLENLTFERTYGDALLLERCSGEIIAVRVRTSLGNGIFANNAGALTLRDCSLSGVYLRGISCRTAPAGFIQLTGNRVSEARQAGIFLEGGGLISGNVVENSEQFGMRLGGAASLGNFLAVNNVVRRAHIGIAVSAADDGYGAISLNMILGAREGAIRALDGEKPVGPDLAKASAESFRHLAIAGNVAL